VCFFWPLAFFVVAFAETENVTGPQRFFHVHGARCKQAAKRVHDSAYAIWLSASGEFGLPNVNLFEGIRP